MGGELAEKDKGICGCREGRSDGIQSGVRMESEAEKSFPCLLSVSLAFFHHLLL